ncbi:MAG: hypothetical protein JWO05_1758 [Gemmatimonadetes bacterium]|nr:hypothetical protein [Gemmatimonadota bacterium]
MELNRETRQDAIREARREVPIYSPSRVYVRDLPGGGHVMIELAPEFADRAPVGRVVVERRCDAARRDGHQPPAIAVVKDCGDGEVNELFRLATDNVAIARALLQWERRSVARGD